MIRWVCVMFILRMGWLGNRGDPLRQPSPEGGAVGNTEGTEQQRKEEPGLANRRRYRGLLRPPAQQYLFRRHCRLREWLPPIFL